MLNLEARYFQEAPDAVIAVDDEGIVVAANATVEVILGYRPDELVGRSVEVLVPERFRSVHRHHRQRFRRHPVRRLMGVGADLWARHADGHELPVDVSLSPVDTDRGLVTMAAIRDISDRRRADAALRASEHRFRLIFDAAPVGMALVGADGTFRRVNPALADMVGVTPEDIEGRRVDEWVVDRDVRRIVAALQSASASVEVRLHTAGSASRWVTVSCASVSGDLDEVVAVVEDVTERRRDRLELEHRATHDVLTGLANRALLEERLRVAAARRRRTGQHFGVLFLDLDGFKAINDEFGHVAGDAVLVEIARRVATCVRPEDTTARQGGDEFVVCCEDLGTDADAARETLYALAARLAAAVAEPLVLREATFQLSASVGIALGDDDDAAPAGLIAAADAAMYEAKRQGAGGVAGTWELGATAS